MPGSVFNTTFDCRRLEARILSSCGKQARQKHSPEVTHQNSSSLLQRNQLLESSHSPKFTSLWGSQKHIFTILCSSVTRCHWHPLFPEDKGKQLVFIWTELETQRSRGPLTPCVSGGVSSSQLELCPTFPTSCGSWLTDGRGGFRTSDGMTKPSNYQPGL